MNTSLRVFYICRLVTTAIAGGITTRAINSPLSQVNFFSPASPIGKIRFNARQNRLYDLLLERRGLELRSSSMLLINAVSTRIDGISAGRL